jgi:hypothetical protein
MTAFESLKKLQKRKIKKKEIILFSSLLFISFIIFGIVRIFALDESNWSIGDGGNTTLITGSSDSVVITASEVTLDSDNTWLGLDWNYKKSLEVKNISNIVLPQGDTVTVIVNTSELESVQDDCDDLRVGYVINNSVREIPRDIVLGSGSTSCLDSKDTRVSFKLVKELSNSTVEGYVNGDEVDSNYVLFYGNESVGVPSYPGEKYLSFGSDYTDYIVFPKMTPAGSMQSINLWVRITDSELSGTHVLVSATEHNVFYIKNGYLKFDTYGYTSGVQYTTGLTQLPTNEWVNIGMTYSTTEGVRFFINGEVDIFNPEHIGEIDHQNSCGLLTIGSTGNAALYNIGEPSFYGDIDEVAVWADSLSVEEMKDVYLGKITEENLYLLYHLDSSNQTVLDSSGSGNNGFLGNTIEVEGSDPSFIDSGTSVYNVSSTNSTLACPLNGSSTCVNGDTPTIQAGAIRYSSSGSALSFSSLINSYVIVPDDDTLDFLDSFGICYWINHKANYPDGKYIFRKASAYQEYIGTAGDTYPTIYGIEGSDSRLPHLYQNINNWVHYCVTYSGATSSLLKYKNGVQVSSNTSAIDFINQNSNNLYLGQRIISDMDEIALFNKFLTQEDVTDYYNNPIIESNEPSLVALYHFDENGMDPRLSSIKTDLETTLGVSGNGVAYDASGNGNHGLVVGAVYTNNTPIGNSGVMSHEGVLLEEGTTNKVLNPSFENDIFDKYWSKGYQNLDLGSSTFTAKMAKRNSEGPFAAGVMSQGFKQVSHAGDEIGFSTGTLISKTFYPNFDNSQGSVVLWVTPTWDGTDLGEKRILGSYNSSGFRMYKLDSNLIFRGTAGSVSVDISSWQTGETHLVVGRWDEDSIITGSNRLSLTVDGVTTYGGTSDFSMNIVGSFDIGDYYGFNNANAIIEGLTIYRRVLYDGTYGTDIGNGNEISQIYNSGVGKDPTEITGSWDVVFCLPTDGSTGELTTTNQAWSMPHSSNLLGTGGFMMSDSADVDGWDNYSSNKIVNDSFESNLDNWNYEQEYLLRDEFNTDGPITLVDGGLSAPAPSLGSELLTNGDMEIGDPPTGWTPNSSSLSASVDSHSGSQSIQVLADSGQNGRAIQNIPVVSNNAWYMATVWAKRTAGVNSIYLNIPSNVFPGDKIRSEDPAVWSQIFKSFRTTGTSIGFYNQAYYDNTALYDDASVKPLVLSSLFSTTTEATVNKVVSTDVTLTPGTQAGVVLNLDSEENPQNFVIAYHDGTNLIVEKCVNGTYTTLMSGAKTMVDGAVIRVAKNGNKYLASYNGDPTGEVTVTDASIVDNTLYGLFSTYSGNTFSNFKITTNLDGSLASDGVSERKVVDTLGYLSIENGYAKFQRTLSPEIWTNYNLPVIQREVGRMMISSASSIADGQYYYTGFSTGAGIAPFTHSFALQNGGIVYTGAGNVNVGSPATSQDSIIVLRNSGAYYFVKSESYPRWTLMWISPSGTTTNLYPSVGLWRGTDANVDYVSVPEATWLPTPLAYDTFTRADGEIGVSEATGPDLQMTPSLDWAGGVISSGKSIITPELGSELVTNGGFDSDTAWTKTGQWLISNGNANVTATGTSSLSQSILSSGNWYSASVDTSGGPTYEPEVLFGGYFSGNGYGAGGIFTGRAGAGTAIQFNVYNGWYATVDNISVKPLTFSSLFSTISTDNTDIVEDINITSIAGTQAGIVTNLDSEIQPNAGILAYLVRVNNSTGAQIRIDKFTSATTWVNLQSTSVTYSPGATLRVITYHSDLNTLKVRVYYNNALVGSEQTITDPEIINNTRHGLFSTYEGNTFDNFSIFARGTDGEYNDIPAEDILAIRSTSVSYDGASSVSLNTGSSNDKFTQTKSLENGYIYDLSVYAYTDGSAVSNSDLVLNYNNENIPTTYTDMGSGWYKLTGTFTGVSGNTEVGVNVMAEKSVYVDKMEVFTKQSLKEGLLGYWSFDDSSGTRYDLENSNDFLETGTVPSISGVHGNAVQFYSTDTNESKNELTIPSQQMISSGTESFSLGFWVRFDGMNDFYSGILNNDSHGFLLFSSGNHTAITISANLLGGGMVRLSTPDLTIGQWYFFQTWYDGESDRIGYQLNDNAPVLSDIGSVPEIKAIGNFILGGKFYEWNDISIDEMFFYNRVLSNDERNEFYNSGDGRTYGSFSGSPLSSNSKIFSGGYSVSSDNLGGMYKEISITTGQDIVIRGIANSDGTSIPRLSVYDITNDLEIGYLDGTNTSTKDNPDNLLFTAEGTLESKSEGSITLSTNPIDGEMVEIGGITYTFKEDITNPGIGEIYVKIGVDNLESTSNLNLAISDGGVLDTNYSYGTSSVAHTLVDSSVSSNIVSLLSKTVGLAGNNITLSKIGSSILLSNTTLLGGTDNSNNLRIRLLNSSNTVSNVNWHQVEVYNNLVNNPSFERGEYDADGNWVPGGWTLSNWESGDGFLNVDTTDLHSGSSSVYSELLDSKYYYLKQYAPIDSTKYLAGGIIGRVDNFSSPSQNISFSPAYNLGSNQSGVSSYTYNSGKIYSPSLDWKSGNVVARMINSGSTSKAFHVYFGSTYASGQVNIDDVYRFNLNPVDLSVTPSSYVNSQTEDGGTVVNGRDSFTETLTEVDGTDFTYRFKFIPAYDDEVLRKVGVSGDLQRQYIYFIQFANGYLALAQEGVNSYYAYGTPGTDINGGVGDLNLRAGTEYLFETSWKYPGNYEIKLDNQVIYSGSTTEAATGNPLVYIGSASSGANYDGTYYPYPSSTITENTNLSFVKYGTSSTHIVTSTANDEYLTEIDLGNTNNHTISAYVYNNTSGSVGGIVDSNIAQLVFNNNVVSTTYTDEGGGWYRLSYTGAGIVGTTNYGVQVKGSKDVYVDGLQIEEKGYETTYADGSLGTGYSWSGIANESSSGRTASDIVYTTGLAAESVSNSVSIWFYYDPTVKSGLIRHIHRNMDAPGGNTFVQVDTAARVLFRNVNATNTSATYTFCPNESKKEYSWNHVVTTVDEQNDVTKCCLNGVCSSEVSFTGIGTLPKFQSIRISGHDASYAQGNMEKSDLRIYDEVLTEEQILQLYNQGMNVYSTGVSSNGKYAVEGTWTSQVIDLSNNGQWGISPSLLITDNKGSDNIVYQTRTSPDNVNWTNYEGVVINGEGYDFISPPNRYLQVKAILQSSNQSSTPSFSGMSFRYVQDTVKPSVNASNIQYYSSAQGGQLQTPNNWTNIHLPYISWTEGQDNTEGSGLRGYCLYLGQDPNADPALEGGLLSSTSPVHTTETECEFIIDTPYIDLSNTEYHGDIWMSSSNTDYYFKVKAVDYTGNVYGTTVSDSETYTFKLDNTLPLNPKGISAPQEYQREISSFTLYWAETGLSAASDAHSGIKGYQYRIGEDGLWFGTNHTGDQDCQDLLTNTTYTLQEVFEGEEIGDELEIGENVFYVRTWDNICNVTETYATAILQYSADAPSRPTNLTVVPSENSINEFSFDWDIPETFSGQEGGLQYCYTVNIFPSSNSCNWTSFTNLNADAYANQPGENILYVVAMDEAGNINYDDYTGIKFYANTSAPGIVQNLEISDISIKSTSKWKLALAWDQPDETGAGVASYRIYRSDVTDSNYSADSSSFELIGTTSGESYTDVNLQQKEYYYIVKACDSANNCSAASNTVHMLPTGRFYVPAEIVTNPKLTHVSTKSATITWVTERESDSRIQYGLSSGEYFEEEISNSEQVVEHSLTLNNLEAGTTYYFKTRWTDEDGNTGMTDEMSFKTEPPPSVKDVEETYVNLESAGIRFTTKGASKVKVYYGKDVGLSSSTELETSPVETTYTVTLTGLEDGTKYFYKINLFDIDGNEYDGTVLLDFLTPPKPEITNVEIQEKHGTAQPTMEILWESNTEVNSIVRYYPSGKKDLVQNRVDIEMIKGMHKMELNGLLPTTTYTMTVEGTDKLGNTALSEEYTFTTATDTRPPQIYDLKVDKSVLSSEVQADKSKSGQLVVSWKTDEPSTSQVMYDSGLGDTYQQKTKVETNLKTEHVVIISNLTPSTVYHLQVSSLDSASNEGKGSRMIAVTPKATNTVFEVVVESLSNIFKFLR